MNFLGVSISCFAGIPRPPWLHSSQVREERPFSWHGLQEVFAEGLNGPGFQVSSQGTENEERKGPRRL